MPKAIWNEQVIAETTKFETVEGNVYFPPDSLRQEFFKPSATQTTCSWKGEASYYNVVVGGKTNPDAAWFYPAPKEAAANIKGYVAFWKGVQVLKTLAVVFLTCSGAPVFAAKFTLCNPFHIEKIIGMNPNKIQNGLDGTPIAKTAEIAAMGGSVIETPAGPFAYNVGAYRVCGKWALAFEKNVKTKKTKATSAPAILSAVLVPDMAATETLAMTSCSFEGKKDPEIAAIVPTNLKDDQLQARHAWRANRKTEKIEAISDGLLDKVRCRNTYIES